MTTYALVQGDTVVQVGAPRVWFDGARWWDFRPGDPATFAAAGWLPVTETARPDDTATEFYTVSVDLVGGVPTQVWVADPKPVEQVNRETIEAQAVTALTANTAYLAVNNPSQAQAIAQVEALTRQVNKLIRLVLNRLDDTE